MLDSMRLEFDIFMVLHSEEGTQECTTNAV